MYAWQFAKAQHTAERHGWTKFVTMQNHYNLVYREEEREMLPLCLDQGVGAIPWSPLARGFLTRDPNQSTARSETDEFGKTLYATANTEIVEQLGAIAAERGVSRAAVGLAWVRKHPAVTAPIVGATKPQHLEDALASLDVVLTPDEIQQRFPYLQTRDLRAATRDRQCLRRKHQQPAGEQGDESEDDNSGQRFKSVTGKARHKP